MNNCSVISNHSSYPRRSLWFSTLIPVVVNPISSPCRVNLLFILIDDGYFSVVFYPVSGRYNPLFDSYLHPIFGDDIPSSAWIIALITQFIPSGSSLVYLVVVSNDCSSPELVIILYLVSVSRCLFFSVDLSFINPVTGCG